MYNGVLQQDCELRTKTQYEQEAYLKPEIFHRSPKGLWIQCALPIMKILGQHIFFIIQKFSLLRGIKYIEVKNTYSRHRYSFQH
jgi:hypothetical protein